MRKLLLIFLLLLITLIATVLHWESWRYQLALRLPQTLDCTLKPNQELEHFVQSLQAHGLPGGQVSIINSGGLSQHCAFGWQLHGLSPQKVSKGNTFQYASLSKIITALTTMHLAQDDHLTLSTSLVELLQLSEPFRDERIAKIQVQHLLNHRAGFDRAVSGDPMFTTSPWCPNQTEHLNQLQLDFSPGEKMLYSNLGYCLLGAGITNRMQRQLETISHKQLQLSHYSSIKPVTSPRFQANEVRYFFQAPDRPSNLAQLNYSAMLSSGGWGGNATDLAQLIVENLAIWQGTEASLPNNGYAKNCSAEQWRQCHGLLYYKSKVDEGRIIYWRDGSLPGITAYTAITEKGDVLVLLSNYRSYNWLDFNDRLGQLVTNVSISELLEHKHSGGGN